jgi:hypothetical protein
LWSESNAVGGQVRGGARPPPPVGAPLVAPLPTTRAHRGSHGEARPDRWSRRLCGRLKPVACDEGRPAGSRPRPQISSPSLPDRTGPRGIVSRAPVARRRVWFRARVGIRRAHTPGEVTVAVGKECRADPPHTCPAARRARPQAHPHRTGGRESPAVSAQDAEAASRSWQKRMSRPEPGGCAMLMPGRRHSARVARRTARVVEDGPRPRPPCPRARRTAHGSGPDGLRPLGEGERGARRRSCGTSSRRGPAR